MIDQWWLTTRVFVCLCQATEEDHKDRLELLAAIQAMTDVAQAINEYKRRKDLGMTHVCYYTAWQAVLTLTLLEYNLYHETHLNIVYKGKNLQNSL